jgi:hypothetical protein
MVKKLKLGWGTDKDINFLQLKTLRKHFPLLEITYLNGPFKFNEEVLKDENTK